MAKGQGKGTKRAGFGQAGAFGLPVLVGACVVALVVGLVVGHFVLGGGKVTPAFAGKTSVSEGDLDQVMATYTYDGKTDTVTVRQAIESQTSLDKAKTDDGSYTIPSSDAAIDVARNRILAQIAEEQGITVSDDELPSYAEKMTGVSDMSTLASTYGLTEDQAKEIVRESAAMSKLKDKVVTTQTGDAPTAPETPADGNQDTANATYGSYIINLLGDEWDSTNNTWARQDGPYYAALKDETFSADSATYAQAQMAYYVAYQQYSTNARSSSSEWTDYVNQTLSKATIQLVTLGA